MTTLRVGKKRAANRRRNKPKPKPKAKPKPKPRPKPVPVTAPERIPHKMQLWSVGARTQLVIPYAPRDVTYTVGTRTWTEVARDGGRPPLLVNNASSLTRIQMSMFVGHQDWDAPITGVLNGLRTIANSSQKVLIRWSSWESGHWRITNLSWTSQMRQAETNEITRAQVEIEFTQVSDARRNIGPATGGKGGDGDKDDDKKPRPKKYKVRKGDTLWKIAMKFYGNHKAWRRIGKANDIKRPRRKLKVGRVLVLPGGKRKKGKDGKGGKEIEGKR